MWVRLHAAKASEAASHPQAGAWAIRMRTEKAGNDDCEVAPHQTGPAGLTKKGGQGCMPQGVVESYQTEGGKQTGRTAVSSAAQNH